MISSFQNIKIKLIRNLMGRPKERREAQAFVAEGVRLVEEALSAGWPFQFVLFSEDLNLRGKELIGQLINNGIECEEAGVSLLQALSDTGNTQGILAVLDHNQLQVPEILDFILIPDQIRDPGNLGTLLRTAEAAGIQAVFLPPETTDAFAPKVVRSGMGAHFHLPILEQDWESIRKRTKGMQVLLSDMDGKPCWDIEMRSPVALIVGGEAEGASFPARQLAYEVVGIPMPGKAESLNVGVAGAILMFEVVRQRRKK